MRGPEKEGSIPEIRKPLRRRLRDDVTQLGSYKLIVTNRQTVRIS
ncbi:MAG: hypothetical protein ACRDBM_07805 [Sporomusa sp.]